MDTATTSLTPILTPIATLAEVRRLAATLVGVGLPAADAMVIAGRALTGATIGDSLVALRRAGAIDAHAVLGAYGACRTAA